MKKKLSVKRLRESGFSFREIARETNIPYSSTRRICKNVKMSKSGLNRYHSKVKGIKKLIKINDSPLLDNKIRIICNLIFDGSVYKSGYDYAIMYVNSSINSINQFMEDMKEVYNVSPSSFEELKGKNIKCFRIKYCSKDIFTDLLKYIDSYNSLKSSLPYEIMQGKMNYKLIALKAFWDNEGSISKDGKLAADLKNLSLIKQLSQLHQEFGISHYISKYWKNGWAYKLVLSKNKNNYNKFLELGLFSNSVVSKGVFIGKKKSKVLKNYIKEKEKWTC